MGRKSKKQLLAEMPKLGYKLSVSEIDRISDVALRMLHDLQNSDESRKELDGAIYSLAELSTPTTCDIIARLQNSIAGEKMMLEGAITDANYIISRLKALAARLQLDAAIKAEQIDKQIKETF